MERVQSPDKGIFFDVEFKQKGKNKDEHIAINSINYLFLFSGVYLFNVQYNTRTCGALSLCGPTTVNLFKNINILRSFSRNLATDRKSDMDMV